MENEMKILTTCPNQYSYKSSVTAFHAVLEDATQSFSQNSTNSRRKSIYFQMLQNGKVSELERRISEDLSYNREDPFAFYMQAKLLEKMKLYSKAIDLYEEALRLD